MLCQISTVHSRKSTGVNTTMNDGWLPFSWSRFQGPGIVHACSLSRLTGIHQQNWAIVDITSYTSLFSDDDQSNCQKKGQYFSKLIPEVSELAGLSIPTQLVPEGVEGHNTCYINPVLYIYVHKYSKISQYILQCLHMDTLSNAQHRWWNHYTHTIDPQVSQLWLWNSKTDTYFATTVSFFANLRMESSDSPCRRGKKKRKEKLSQRRGTFTVETVGWKHTEVKAVSTADQERSAFGSSQVVSWLKSVLKLGRHLIAVTGLCSR